MYKKHLTVLPMFRDIVGAEKRVAELRQADVNEFLSIVERLPPRWKDEARRRRMTVRDLAEVVHAKNHVAKVVRRHLQSFNSRISQGGTNFLVRSRVSR